MKKVTAELFIVGRTTEADADLFMRWMYEQKDTNNFDMDTLREPRAVICKASRGDEPIMFLPAHPILMYESLAKKPGLPDMIAAMGLWRIGQLMESAMRDTGLREAYFLTNSEAEANTTEAHGWIKALYDPVKRVWLMKRKIVDPVLHSVGPENTLPSPIVETEDQDA